MKFYRLLFLLLAFSLTSLYGWSWSETKNTTSNGLSYVYEIVHGSNGSIESTILHCAGPTNKSNYTAENLVIPEQLTFEYYDSSSYKYKTVTKNVTSLYSNAFKDCTGLTGTVTLPSGLTQISESAFEGCTGIKEVVFPSSLKTIEASAFKGCTGLTQLDFPASLKTIGNSAFSNCTGLTDILTLTSNLTALGDYAFSGCTGITGINFPENMPQLGEYAFAYCTGLTGTLTLTGNVGVWAFAGCTNITDIVFPTNSHVIREYAFLNCTGLTGELYLTATSIGTGSFMNCTGLTSLVLAKTVSQIGGCSHSEWNVSFQTNAPKHGYKDTFVGCTGLESITVYGAPPSFDYWSYNLNGDCFEDYTVPLYVESDFYSRFASEWQWVKFNNVYKLAKGISLSASNLTVKVGERGIINYSLTPVDAASTNLKWTPEDVTIATVSDGIVTGLKVGQTFVTVSCGTVSAKCLVTVVADSQGGNAGTETPGDGNCVWHQDGDEDAAVHKRIFMIPDEEDDFTKLLGDLTASTWTSGDEEVVEVTRRGLAYSYDCGETVVRAKDSDGKTIAVIEVFVCPTVTVEHGDGVLYSHHVLYNSTPRLTLNPGVGYKIAGVTHDGKVITETLVGNDGKYTPVEPIADHSVINLALEETGDGPTTGASSVWSDSDIRIYIDGHHIKIVGVPTGTYVVLTNMAGKELFHDKYYEFDVVDAGVYIVNIEDRNFKILVK